MTDVGYVAAGWVITFLVLGVYWLRLTIRIRRIENKEETS